MYQGEPIVAVAAIDELTAAEAIEKIKVEYEPLPWVVDPMVTLRPGGPNARAEGNVWRPPQVAEIQDFASSRRRAQCGPYSDARGHADHAGKSATSTRASRRPIYIARRNGGASVHRPSGRWSRARRWPTGRTASSICTDPRSRWRGPLRTSRSGSDSSPTRRSGHRHQRVHRRRIRRQDSRARRRWRFRRCCRRRRAAGRCMMRITREEENYIGRARPGIHLRARIGFRKDGRIIAMDMCAIGDCGPYSNQGDVGHARVDRDGALQPGKHPVPRRQRPHQHAAARRAARAGRRAGVGDARADDQQGRAPSRRRPGRDSQDQRAHRHEFGPPRRQRRAGGRGAPVARGAPADPAVAQPQA